MNKFLGSRLNRFVPAGLIALAAAVLLAPASASATPYVVKLVQQGSNVVATGNGAIDLTGLGPVFSGLSGSSTYPIFAFILLGPTSGGIAGYGSISGPSDFGSGLETLASSGSGDFAGVCGSSGCSGGSQIDVPVGYTSDSSLSGTATWDDASFASLGVTPGTYVWSWGSAADQTFTLIIGNAISAPEPAEFGIFGLGLLLIGGFEGLRRRAA